MPKNKKKGMRSMSKLFMYGTSLEGIEQLAVECTQSLLPTVKFLDIPDMRPTTIYFINRVRASMVMMPNFQPRGSGMVINNYFNCQGGGKDCDISVINVDDNCKNCGYDDWNFKVNVDKKRYKDIVMDCFGRIKNHSLRDRLKELSKSFKGEVFLNYQHKERFYNFHQEESSGIDDRSSRFLAILFLLSADKNLWKNSKEILRDNRLTLKRFVLKILIQMPMPYIKLLKHYQVERNV